MKRGIVFLVLVGIALFAAWFFWLRGDESPNPSTAENTTQLEQELISPDRATQEAALAPELRGGEWATAAALPEGATLKIDSQSFRVTDSQHGTVKAIVSMFGKTREFTIGLELVDGKWLIDGTSK